MLGSLIILKSHVEDQKLYFELTPPDPRAPRRRHFVPPLVMRRFSASESFQPSHVIRRRVTTNFNFPPMLPHVLSPTT